MSAPKKALRILLLLMGVTAVGAVPLGQAQGPLKPRLGRPLDWSHFHLMASRGGPDRGLGIYSDWRTLFRHIEIDQTRATIKQQRENSTRRGLGFGLPALTLVGLALAGRGFKKSNRKRLAGLALGLLLALLALEIACGGSLSPPPGGSTPDLKLDWSLNTGGTGSVLSFPAKFSFDITASSCTDVIYFTVNQAGAAATVNVIGITNPYAGCTGNPTGGTPTVKFGIALGTGTATSPVFSLDGSVLYVIESRPSGSGGPILHAINVDNITVNPGTYDFGTGIWTSTHTLAAPTGLPGSEQLFALTFAGVTNAVSSPYLDYTTNQIFFGDSIGRIHRVINANSTTASEDTTNFPVTCGAAAIRSPVFVSGQVIATSGDGRVYRIDTTVAPPFSCVASAAVGAGTGAAAGELASPVIDVTNSKIIVVTGADTLNGDKRMALLNLNFTAGAGPVSSVLIGAGSTVLPRIPSFDNAFLTTNTGNLYVGGSPTGANGAYLIRVSYNGSTFTGSLGFADLHHTGAAQDSNYSSVTVFLTASLLANPEFAYIGGSATGYRFMSRIATGFAGTNVAPVAVDGFFAVPGGIDSGIIIDNRTAGVTGGTATANIYFGTIGNVPAGTQSTVVQLAQQF